MQAARQQIETGELVTQVEAGLVLGLSPFRIQGLALAGALVATTVNGRLRILKSSVEARRRQELEALETRTADERALVDAAIESGATVPSVAQALERERAKTELERAAAKQAAALHRELNAGRR